MSGCRARPCWLLRKSLNVWGSLTVCSKYLHGHQGRYQAGVVTLKYWLSLSARSPKVSLSSTMGTPASFMGQFDDMVIKMHTCLREQSADAGGIGRLAARSLDVSRLPNIEARRHR